MDSNILHQPIKFSIKTNDLEKLKKKPDKVFDKIDGSEEDDNLKESKFKLGLFKRRNTTEPELKNKDSLNGRPAVSTEGGLDNLKIPSKRVHQPDVEPDLIKSRKIEEDDQVIIEPETSSALVIKALPRSSAPTVVSKDDSILKIFSKCKDVMTSKLEEKIDAIENICQSSSIESSNSKLSSLISLTDNKTTKAEDMGRSKIDSSTEQLKNEMKNEVLDDKKNIQKSDKYIKADDDLKREKCSKVVRDVKDERDIKGSKDFKIYKDSKIDKGNKDNLTSRGEIYRKDEIEPLYKVDKEFAKDRKRTHVDDSEIFKRKSSPKADRSSKRETHLDARVVKDIIKEKDIKYLEKSKDSTSHTKIGKNTSPISVNESRKEYENRSSFRQSQSNHKSPKVYSHSKYDSSDKEARVRKHHDPRPRSRDSRHYDDLRSPKMSKVSESRTHIDGYEKSDRSFEMGTLNLREDLDMENEIVFVNAEDALEQSFKCDIMKNPTKVKKNIADKLKKLLNKNKILDDDRDLKAKSSDELSKSTILAGKDEEESSKIINPQTPSTTPSTKTQNSKMMNSPEVSSSLFKKTSISSKSYEERTKSAKIKELSPLLDSQPSTIPEVKETEQLSTQSPEASTIIVIGKKEMSIISEIESPSKIDLKIQEEKLKVLETMQSSKSITIDTKNQEQTSIEEIQESATPKILFQSFSLEAPKNNNVLSNTQPFVAGKTTITKFQLTSRPSLKFPVPDAFMEQASKNKSYKLFPPKATQQSSSGFSIKKPVLSQTEKSSNVAVPCESIKPLQIEIEKNPLSTQHILLESVSKSNDDDLSVNISKNQSLKIDEDHSSNIISLQSEPMFPTSQGLGNESVTNDVEGTSDISEKSKLLHSIGETETVDLNSSAVNEQGIFSLEDANSNVIEKSIIMEPLNNTCNILFRIPDQEKVSQKVVKSETATGSVSAVDLLSLIDELIFLHKGDEKCPCEPITECERLKYRNEYVIADETLEDKTKILKEKDKFAKVEVNNEGRSKEKSKLPKEYEKRKHELKSTKEHGNSEMEPRTSKEHEKSRSGARHEKSQVEIETEIHKKSRTDDRRSKVHETSRKESKSIKESEKSYSKSKKSQEHEILSVKTNPLKDHKRSGIERIPSKEREKSISEKKQREKLTTEAKHSKEEIYQTDEREKSTVEAKYSQKLVTSKEEILISDGCKKSISEKKESEKSTAEAKHINESIKSKEETEVSDVSEKLTSEKKERAKSSAEAKHSRESVKSKKETDLSYVREKLISEKKEGEKLTSESKHSKESEKSKGESDISDRREKSVSDRKQIEKSTAEGNRRKEFFESKEENYLSERPEKSILEKNLSEKLTEDAKPVKSKNDTDLLDEHEKKIAKLKLIKEKIKMKTQANSKWKLETDKSQDKSKEDQGNKSEEPSGCHQSKDIMTCKMNEEEKKQTENDCEKSIEKDCHLQVKQQTKDKIIRSVDSQKSKQSTSSSSSDNDSSETSADSKIKVMPKIDMLSSKIEAISKPNEKKPQSKKIFRTRHLSNSSSDHSKSKSIIKKERDSSKLKSSEKCSIDKKKSRKDSLSKISSRRKSDSSTEKSKSREKRQQKEDEYNSKGQKQSIERHKSRRDYKSKSRERRKSDTSTDSDNYKSKKDSSKLKKERISRDKLKYKSGCKSRSREIRKTDTSSDSSSPDDKYKRKIDNTQSKVTQRNSGTNYRSRQESNSSKESVKSYSKYKRTKGTSKSHCRNNRSRNKLSKIVKSQRGRSKKINQHTSCDNKQSGHRKYHKSKKQFEESVHKVYHQMKSKADRNEEQSLKVVNIFEKNVETNCFQLKQNKFNSVDDSLKKRKIGQDNSMIRSNILISTSASPKSCKNEAIRDQSYSNNNDYSTQEVVITAKDPVVGIYDVNLATLPRQFMEDRISLPRKKVSNSQIRDGCNNISYLNCAKNNDDGFECDDLEIKRLNSKKDCTNKYFSQEFPLRKEKSECNEDADIGTINSSASSLVNFVLDMDIASPLKSVDGIHMLKLNNEQSDKDDLSSCNEYYFEDEEPCDPFDRFPDAPRPTYEHITTTDVHKSVIDKRLEYAYLKSVSCNCVPPNPDEILEGKLACGESCFNRKIKVECNRNCPVYELCTNRRFQEQIYAPMEPFYSGEHKGWGIRARLEIPASTFIIEYVGELIDFREFKNRIYKRSSIDHHFAMIIQNDMYLDSSDKGNWSRFVNHSCYPNTVLERWVVNGKTRIGLFSKRPISKNEEVTIDYQFQQYGSTETKCYCASTNCTGIIGKVDEKLQEQIKASESRYRNELTQRVISKQCLKDIDDVSEMITVLKESGLERDTFFKFLELFKRSYSEQCLRTFIECGGLYLVTTSLDNISWDDWPLKLLYLQCLDHFRLGKRNLLNSGYSSAFVVEYWSRNPRYIFKHISGDNLSVEEVETVNSPLGSPTSIQCSLPDSKEPINEMEREVQLLAITLKDYFIEQKKRFSTPKIRESENEISKESESKSVSIASSHQDDFVRRKRRKFRRNCNQAVKKLSKDEFQGIFSERCNKSLSEKNQSSMFPENTHINSLDVFRDIKQILSNLKIINSDEILSSSLVSPYIKNKLSSVSTSYESSDDECKIDTSTPNEENDQLPPNWKRCCSTKGRIYFYHTISKKTQWEVPVYPWDADEKESAALNFGHAHNYQVTNNDIQSVHMKLKENLKEENLREKQRKKLETSLMKKLFRSDGTKNKIKFSREVFKAVKMVLKPYFSSSCKVGRVTSKADLKFLCEKFAEIIIGKEVKLVANLEDLELNSDINSKIIVYIKTYMSNQGRFFRRSKKSVKKQLTSSHNGDSHVCSFTPNLSLLSP